MNLEALLVLRALMDAITALDELRSAATQAQVMLQGTLRRAAEGTAPAAEVEELQAVYVRLVAWRENLLYDPQQDDLLRGLIRDMAALLPPAPEAAL